MGPLEKLPFSPILKGERVTLRRPEPSHAGQLWQRILKEREARGVSWPWLESEEHLSRWLTKIAVELHEKEAMYLIEVEGSQIAGTFHVHSMSYADHKTEVGYALWKEFEGHGYVNEALQLIEPELKRLGFNKVVIDCDVENQKSLNAAERAGYRREGTLLQNCIEFGKYRDSAIFGKIL